MDYTNPEKSLFNSFEPTSNHAYLQMISINSYSKTCLKRSLKNMTKIGFQDRLLLNAGQKYCRMLPLEHSAILSTFIKLLFVIKIFVLSIFKTGFTVCTSNFSVLQGYFFFAIFGKVP